MALVKKYCELNNAKLNIESNKRKGTVFTVSIPFKR
ncbi:MAG: ATP-binding protein [Bacteroidetes bacterium]|nr:ATP-binding protein [Bacteroidota bacterium]